MREHRHSASRAHEAHTFQRVGSVVRFEVSGARVQDALERGTARRDVPFRHQRIRNVGPTNCRPLGGLGENVVPAEVVVRGDTGHDTFGAGEPRRANPGGLGDEVCVQRVEQVGEQVNALPAVAGAQFHPGDDRQAGSGCGTRRLLPAGGRIVVGDRHRAEARRHRGPHELCRSFGAVRHTAVRVQIDSPGHGVTLSQRRFHQDRIIDQLL